MYQVTLAVVRRLKDSQKAELLKGFRSGQSTSELAENFGCSQNTVTRIVKSLLTVDEYNELKAKRFSSKAKKLSNGDLSGDVNHTQLLDDQEFPLIEATSTDSPLDLKIDQITVADESFELFHEVIPLAPDFEVETQQEIRCLPLDEGTLPSTVYILVDRSIELDARPLSDYPELGFMSDQDLKRKALYLFSNQRSAKRNCGRNQRVIQVPDSKVFALSTPFLLAQGITRLVLEGSLIALD